MLALIALDFEVLWEAIHILANLGGFALRSVNHDDMAEGRRIDDFLDRRSDVLPFHRRQWLSAVERGTGQRSQYLIAEDGGSIVGILPVTQVRSPLFGNALVSSGFAVGGGVLASTHSAVEALAEAAWQLARNEGCRVVELRGGPVPNGWDRDEGLYSGFRRSLPNTEDAILKSIPRKQRAEVRRALGGGLQVSCGRSPEHVSDHYRVYSESVRNLGTPVFPRQLFEATIEGWKENADILVVKSGPRPVAAVLSLYDGHTVYPYWGGGTIEARTLSANNLLYFALMRHASERGCTTFDFGRSKVGTGPHAFKTNWGFDPEPMVYARKGRPRDVNPLTPKRQLQAAVWKRLPLSLANKAGPLIARGLG